MIEHKRYEVENIGDLRKVPRQKMAALFVDLLEWLRITDKLLSLAPHFMPLDEPGKCTPTRFVWCDDGKHVASVEVSSLLPDGEGVERVRESWDCSAPAGVVTPEQGDQLIDALRGCEAFMSAWLDMTKADMRGDHEKGMARFNSAGFMEALREARTRIDEHYHCGCAIHGDSPGRLWDLAGGCPKCEATEPAR